ncbi:MAG: VanW family protein [Clostridia bacterium]|nr:VanW family protein [Clostridia bacterium]
MLRKTTALLLVLSMLTVGLSAALAAESHSARTPLSGSSSAKLHNIALAVEAINGAVIPYGGRFSFNETVGPRTQSRGYETAPNGRGALVTGGGVAQAASTLYLALLENGDVQLDPIKTYGSRFNDGYVDDPDQAIVTDYDAGIDLSFTNRADTLTIEMWMTDAYVYCAITVGADGDGNNGGSWFVDAPFAPVGTVAPARRLVASASLDCGGDADVLHNVKLAADSVSDSALSSGDTFSFNDIVGPRKMRYGYVRAVNGRGARVTGGGVAQVASALWLAIKDRDDFAIVEKSTYGKKYNQSYVQSSADAILTDYASGRDFAFRYTGAGSVTVYTYVMDGKLYCDIYAN